MNRFSIHLNTVLLLFFIRLHFVNDTTAIYHCYRKFKKHIYLPSSNPSNEEKFYTCSSLWPCWGKLYDFSLCNVETVHQNLVLMYRLYSYNCKISVECYSIGLFALFNSLPPLLLTSMAENSIATNGQMSIQIFWTISIGTCTWSLGILFAYLEKT